MKVEYICRCSFSPSHKISLYLQFGFLYEDVSQKTTFPLIPSAAVCKEAEETVSLPMRLGLLG